MTNVAGPRHVAQQPAETAQDAIAAERPGESGRRLNAVLKGNHEGPLTEQRPHRPRRFFHLPGLGGDDHRVHPAGIRRIFGGVNGGKPKIAADALHPKAAGAQSLQVPAAGDEHDVDAGLGQPPAEIAPYAARAVDCDTHGYFKPCLKSAALPGTKSI